MEGTCESHKLFWGMWVLTALLVAAQLLWPSANGWFAAGLLFSWAAFCVANAWRWGRLHCFVAAPVFTVGGG
jgi:hypothetical protein